MRYICRGARCAPLQSCVSTQLRTAIVLLKASINVMLKNFPLHSDTGADYTRLDQLLAHRQWQQADWETASVMLKVASRDEQGWLTTSDVEKFPCTDLCIIDTLWKKYSLGRFGFSVQARIWQEVGGKVGEVNCGTEHRLGEQVGWLMYHEWLKYSELTFSLNAPSGHLPFYAFLVLEPWFCFGVMVLGGSAIASRIMDCSI